MSEQTFKVGDKVTHNNFGEGVITYGPYVSAGTNSPCYMLKSTTDQAERNVSEGNLKPVPAFAVGDKVIASRFSFVDLYTILAGPYQDAHGGEDFYVLERPDGKHLTARPGWLKPAPAPVSPTYKPGDRIRVLKDGADSARVRKGDVFTVASADGASVVTTIPVGNRYGWHFSFGSVEKVTDVPATHTHAGVTYDLSAKYRDVEGDVWSFTGNLRHGVPEMEYHSQRETITYVVNTWGPLKRV